MQSPIGTRVDVEQQKSKECLSILLWNVNCSVLGPSIGNIPIGTNYMNTQGGLDYSTAYAWHQDYSFYVTLLISLNKNYE